MANFSFWTIRKEKLVEFELLLSTITWKYVERGFKDKIKMRGSSERDAEATLNKNENTGR